MIREVLCKLPEPPVWNAVIIATGLRVAVHVTAKHKKRLGAGSGYETRSEATQSIFEYIEMFYNRRRRNSALGYLSPVSFELEAMAA